MNRRTISTGGRPSHLHSNLPIPPGEYLAEVIDELGVTKTELAAQLPLSAVELDALLTGNAPLTAALAARLEEATSVPANIWLGLEAEYRQARGNRSVNLGGRG